MLPMNRLAPFKTDLKRCNPDRAGCKKFSTLKSASIPRGTFVDLMQLRLLQGVCVSGGLVLTPMKTDPDLRQYRIAIVIGVDYKIQRFIPGLAPDDPRTVLRLRFHDFLREI